MFQPLHSSQYLHRTKGVSAPLAVLPARIWRGRKCCEGTQPGQLTQSDLKGCSVACDIVVSNKILGKDGGRGGHSE